MGGRHSYRGFDDMCNVDSEGVRRAARSPAKASLSRLGGVVKSVASDKLLRLGMIDADVAAAVGRSRPLATMWKLGNKKPNALDRTLIEELWHIPAAEWDIDWIPPDPRKAYAPPAVAPPDPSKQGAAYEAERMLREQITRLSALRDDPDIPMGQRLALERACTRAVLELSRINGEGKEMSESRVMRLPSFKVLLDTIYQAIGDHKVVARVVEALQKLDEAP